MMAKTNCPESQLLHRNFLRDQTYDPLLDEQLEHLPVFLQASRNFYKEGSRANSRTKLRCSAGDMIRSGTSTKICCSSTVKRSGATVEDVTPGYPHGGPLHSLEQGVGRANQLQDGLHQDYFLRKTS